MEPVKEVPIHFGIGSPVWTHDRYVAAGGHSVEYQVLGETTRSWLVGKPGYDERNQYKLPKKGEGDTRTIKVSNYGLMYQTFYLTQKAHEDAMWLGAHRYWVGQFIQNTKLSADVLKQVAKLVGYDEEKDCRR